MPLVVDRHQVLRGEEYAQAFRGLPALQRFIRMLASLASRNDAALPVFDLEAGSDSSSRVCVRRSW